ncbi:MAG: 3'-5' exonuclease [Verrucomicrobiota bacterium]
MKLHLTRPLAFFDIESTGPNRKTDRIIDLAIVKLMPDGTRESHNFRVNPLIPISEESIQIHGIRDEDVKDAPTFKDVAQDVLTCLDDCDLAGYNIHYFDIPVLEEEFQRIGARFETEGRLVIDAQRIYHKMEPRDLTAALKYYCGEEHEGAHGAMADTEATIKVLEGQLEMYEDVPTDMNELNRFCSLAKPDWIDQQGRLKWNSQNEAVINFGRKQDKLLTDLAVRERGFLEWIVKGDFPKDTREICQRALNGVFPKRGED